MDEMFQPTTRKNGVKDLEKLWPNKTVPYLISKNFSKKHGFSVIMMTGMITLQTNS